MVNCKFCTKELEKNVFQHERMCPQNPERIMPSFKGKSEPKTKIETVTKTILKTKTDNDKTAGKPPLNEAVSTMSASPVVSEKPEEEQQPQQQPEQEKQKSWILEICIAIIAILLAAFWIFHYFLMPPKIEEEQKDE